MTDQGRSSAPPAVGPHTQLCLDGAGCGRLAFNNKRHFDGRFNGFGVPISIVASEISRFMKSGPEFIDPDRRPFCLRALFNKITAALPSSIFKRT